MVSSEFILFQLLYSIFYSGFSFILKQIQSLRFSWRKRIFRSSSINTKLPTLTTILKIVFLYLFETETEEQKEHLASG